MARKMIRLVLMGLIGVVSGFVLLAQLGTLRNFVGPDLIAQIELHPMSVPEDYLIDPVVISNELVARMKKRSSSDVALRIMLGVEGNELLRDRAIPRLVNAGVIRRMLEEMEGLGSVIEFASYQSYAEIEISNLGEEDLNDVAMIIPGALKSDGAVLIARPGEMASVSIGMLEAGSAHAIKVWLNLPPEQISQRIDGVLLGADNGVRGAVQLYSPNYDWNGADLQIMRGARWLSIAFSAFISVTAFAIMSLLLVGLVRRQTA